MGREAVCLPGSDVTKLMVERQIRVKGRYIVAGGVVDGQLWHNCSRIGRATR